MKFFFSCCAVLFTGLLPALAVAQEGRPYYGHYMWDGGWHGMFLGPLFMMLFFVVLVVAVVVGIRWFGGLPGHHGHHTPGGKASLDILKERYARGEIDKEEFEERRRVLGE
ncbi:SHOCT domain-containing protein [Pelagibius marinus]|uniref:SHOCT domain-containing protein n=1 Tax=Pelagibius marinus TaxID=2762760 RepID=UPI0018730961|nr:SHOCT domain-containing protein [Pelagibius marinus]